MGSIFSSKIKANKTCNCGHGGEAHQHYRSGTDCGACGRDVCAKFKAVKPGKPVLSFNSAPLQVNATPVTVFEVTGSESKGSKVAA